MYMDDERLHAVFLGQKLRQLRKEQNLTQLELAQQVGITNGQISTIERGVSSPSLNTLHKIARALNVPIPEFFEDDRNKEVELVRKGQARKVVNPDQNLSVDVLLARSGQGGFNALFLELGGGEIDLGPRPSLPEEFFLYALGGRCEILVQEDSYVLDPGDAIFVKAQREQRIRNISGGTVTLLLVSRSEMVAPEVRSLLAGGAE